MTRDTPESEEASTGTDDRSRVAAVASAAGGTGGELLALLGGGVALARAARLATRDRGRAAVGALAGAALIGAGLYQRRSTAGTTTGDGSETGAEEDDAKDVSDEARAHRERSGVLSQSETNPRGVSGEPDVETETGPDEGDVQFTTEQDGGVEPKPSLDEAGEEDPRRPDGEDPVTDDDHVEVNLSEAAMADEASEATGPTPEQSYPAREGTDPEPLSEKAPGRQAEGPVAETGPDAESDRPEDDGAAETDRSDEDEEAAPEPDETDETDDAGTAASESGDEATETSDGDGTGA